MREIALEWREQAALMANGESLPDTQIGQPENAQELAPLLARRASSFLEWVEDDSLWED
jgi:hypothetical protein